MEINDYWLNTRNDKFILFSIIYNIDDCNFNVYKYLGYTANFYEDNEKNVHYTI